MESRNIPTDEKSVKPGRNILDRSTKKAGSACPEDQESPRKGPDPTNEDRRPYRTGPGSPRGGSRGIKVQGKKSGQKNAQSGRAKKIKAKKRPCRLQEKKS